MTFSITYVIINYTFRVHLNHFTNIFTNIITTLYNHLLCKDLQLILLLKKSENSSLKIKVNIIFRVVRMCSAIHVYFFQKWGWKNILGTYTSALLFLLANYSKNKKELPLLLLFENIIFTFTVGFRSEYRKQQQILPWSL